MRVKTFFVNLLVSYNTFFKQFVCRNTTRIESAAKTVFISATAALTILCISALTVCTLTASALTILTLAVCAFSLIAIYLFCRYVSVSRLFLRFSVALWTTVSVALWTSSVTCFVLRTTFCPACCRCCVVVLFHPNSLVISYRVGDN